MSTTTGKTLNLVKPELTDDHKVTIGTDLPANFQKIDDAVSAHLADNTKHNNNGQLIFPATQNPSADANTLDDYREGVWIPTFTSTGATFSYITQVGKYTKIGNLVTASFYLLAQASGTTTNPLYLSGLPFTSFNSSYIQPGASIGLCTFANYPSISIQPNTTVCYIWKQGASTQLTAAELSTQKYLVGSITYYV